MVAGAGHAHAHYGSVEASDHEGLLPAAQAADVLDLRDGADLGVAAIEPRDEQQLAAVGGLDRRGGLIGLDREGDDHAGQDDPGGQG